MAKATGNYLNSALIKMEALANGYTEGIALDNAGRISEGSGENIFLVYGGRILTPPLAGTILPGITRDSVMRLAVDAGYTVVEQQIAREMLYVADEIFFTGTAAEITPIRSVDRITVGSGRRGPVTERLQKEFFSMVEGLSGGPVRLADADAGRGGGPVDRSRLREPAPRRVAPTSAGSAT